MLIDLSHTITDQTITYRGLPAPIICDYLSREESRQHYADGTEFQIGKIEMVSNTGTYIDCPFHRYADGADLSEVVLDHFADLPGELIVHDYQTDGLAIGPDAFAGRNLNGKAVLVRTDWSRHWGTDAYFENHPFLTEEAARYLRDRGVQLVGIDAHNIDDTHTKRRPVHSILLREGILIVEHLTNLAAVSGSRFTFSAVPPKIRGMGTFPVRAFCKVLESD